MASNREEFSAKTKRKLAERAGFRCSFPECPRTTSGPSAEANDASVNLGEACHITAASPGRGARRYAPELSSEKRRGIENGIWMCRTHAKLIDSDETTYPVETLRQWKREAEERAEQRLRNPKFASWRRLRPTNLGVAIGVLGVLLTTLAWILPRGFSSDPDLYSVRVQVLDPKGRPIDGSRLRVSAGNEPHLLPDGWWQVEVPQVKLPVDGRIALWAEHPRWESARKELQLAGDANPSLEIRLKTPRERISGVVVDAEGRPVASARVSARSHKGLTATTNPEGQFELWVTAAQDEKTRLHIEHSAFPAQDGSCYAGRVGCSLVVEDD